MSDEIVAWYVDGWSRAPEKHVFAKETEHFYAKARGKREKKVTDWYRYYATESEAIAAIEARQEREAGKKRDDRIRAAAPDLLEALEGYMSAVEQMNAAMRDGINVHGALASLSGWEDNALAAIAKARNQ